VQAIHARQKARRSSRQHQARAGHTFDAAFLAGQDNDADVGAVAKLARQRQAIVRSRMTRSKFFVVHSNRNVNPLAPKVFGQESTNLRIVIYDQQAPPQSIDQPSISVCQESSR